MTKLISLEAQNFKRLKAVRIEPNDKGITVIAGRNAQGKSSVLDAIQGAIGGKRVTPSKPIRDGQKKSIVVAELDELIVTRTYSDSGSTLSVTDKSGGKIKSPQKVLDKLYGALTFDPLEFARMGSAEQANEVRRVSGLDISALETRRDEIYQKRRDAKVLLRDREAILSRFDDNIEKTERVDAEDLTKQLRKIKGIHDDISYMEDRKTKLRKNYDETKSEIEALQEKLTKMVEEGKAVNRNLDEMYGERDKIDQTAIEARLEDIKAINDKAQKWEDYQKVSEAYKAQLDIVEQYEDQLQGVRDEIGKTIAEVELPVSGMTMGDDGLLLNGMPFSQASQAEQIKASVEMGIGSNPELRLMLVRDGSLFDSDNLALLTKIAEEKDIQVLLERVGTDGDVGVIIEDGEVVN